MPILAELVTNQALFPGDSELQQLLQIFRLVKLPGFLFLVCFLVESNVCIFNARLLGTPNEEMWPGVSKLVNWHEYPQWRPKPLSSAVPNLDGDGLNLLGVS